MALRRTGRGGAVGRPVLDREGRRLGRLERTYGDTDRPLWGAVKLGRFVLIGLFLEVPALRARWLDDLRTIEAALVPVVHQRARRPLTGQQAQLTAAAAVTALRVALEHAARGERTASPADLLRDSLTYLREGARL